MFPDAKPKSKLQIAIDQTLIEMSNQSATSDEYGTMLDRVKVLHKMKEEERPSRVSPDTMVLAATNLIGIALIIRHEQFNVVTSKALSFVLKPR